MTLHEGIQRNAPFRLLEYNTNNQKGARLREDFPPLRLRTREKNWQSGDEVHTVIIVYWFIRLRMGNTSLNFDQRSVKGIRTAEQDRGPHLLARVRELVVLDVRSPVLQACFNITLVHRRERPRKDRTRTC